MKTKLSIIIALLLCPGCTSSFEGIRLRARAPAMEDAFRKISIAIGLDDYSITSSDAGSHRVETAWRDLKKEERTESERVAGGAVTQVRLTLSLMQRGSMFDVLLGVYVRKEGGDVTGSAVPAGHPLAVKWLRTLNALVDRESREED